MNARMLKAAIACLLGPLAALLSGCGGGDGGGGIFAGLDREVRTFWATDLRTNTDYQLRAYKAGEGDHCYVFVEVGRSISPATANALANEFDTKIYPGATGAFGSEPNPGIDGDAKIYILLLDIRDGFNPPTDNSYVGGYFYAVNEFRQSDVGVDNLWSNEKEMFYMDINPGVAGSRGFLRTLAHEFQHMIHFRQKYAAYGLDDDVWLNEAMSEIAPVYCSYGPDYERVYTFETEPWNSLTIWGNRVADYGVAYMWAQYVKDRVDPASGNSCFWRMLHAPETGIASVNAALAEIGYGKDFGGLFRDWAVANYSGSALSWAGHPEWSYATVNTWPGPYPVGGASAVNLPGLFGDPSRTDCTTLQPLGAWSLGYYLYTPQSGDNGAVTWTAAPFSLEWASLADNAVLAYGLTSGSPCSFRGAGYLVVANPSTAGGNGLVVTMPLLPPLPATTAAMLAETGRDEAVRGLVAMTGRPVPVCVQPLLKDRARPLVARGVRPPR